MRTLPHKTCTLFCSELLRGVVGERAATAVASVVDPVGLFCVTCYGHGHSIMVRWKDFVCSIFGGWTCARSVLVRLLVLVLQGVRLVRLSVWAL